jgi:hypothetical protein
VFSIENRSVNFCESQGLKEFMIQSDDLAKDLMLHERKPTVQIGCLTCPLLDPLDPDQTNLLFPFTYSSSSGISMSGVLVVTCSGGRQ